MQREEPADQSGDQPGDPFERDETAGQEPQDPQDAQGERDEQDAAWQEIVANFGERAVLDPVDAPPDPLPDGPRPAPTGHDPDLEDDGVRGSRGALADPEEDLDAVDEVDAFVPETPPPVPIPSADRFLAWLGVFGSPAVLLVFLVLGIGMPTWLGWLLVGSFVIGFCYLVYRLPRTPRDPWDDGARV